MVVETIGMDTNYDLAQTIRDIPDFPQKGVLFKDITTLLKDPKAFRNTIDRFAARFENRGIDLVVGMESRGFIFGAPLAYSLGAGFVPVRKPGKLPAACIQESYTLEYGTSALEIHEDAIQPGQSVLIVDDLLATGGTVKATIDLVKRLQGDPVALAFVIELSFLHGRERLEGYDIFSLITY
jgi:adenine phosphoribosyltransferase